MTCDRWWDVNILSKCQVNIISKCQVPSSNGLGVKGFLKIWRKKGDSPKNVNIYKKNKK